jgi:hypothetical protein
MKNIFVLLCMTATFIGLSSFPNRASSSELSNSKSVSNLLQLKRAGGTCTQYGCSDGGTCNQYGCSNDGECSQYGCP